MNLSIDPSSAIPPFEQVREQILDAVQSGQLSPGTRLTPVRALAQELGVAAGTIARAYRELEGAAVIETRGRAGTFVSMSSDPARRRIELAATAFADQARSIRMDPDEALALVAAALRR